MKNIKKILIIFIMTFMIFIPNVNAKESFRKVWYTPREKILKELDAENQVLKLSLQNNVYEYNEGYVTSRIDLSVTNLVLEETLTTYDYDGKKLESKTFENRIFIAVKNYNEYLYALTLDYVLPAPTSNVYTSTNSSPSYELDFNIVKLNSKLDIVAIKKVDTKLSKMLGDFLEEIITNNGGSQDNIDEAKGYLENALNVVTPMLEFVLRHLTYDCITINDNKVDIFGLGNAFEFDLELKTQTVIELNKNNIGNYFPDIEREIKEIEGLVNQFLNTEDVNYMAFNIPLSSGVSENKDKTIAGGIQIDFSTNKPLSENALEIQLPLKYVMNNSESENTFDNSEINLSLSNNILNNYLSSLDTQNQFGKAMTIKDVNKLYGFASSNGIIDFENKIFDKIDSLAQKIELDANNTLRLSLSGYLKVYDKNDKLLFEHKSSEYLSFINTHIIDDYVVTLGVKYIIDDNVINIGDFLDSEDGFEKLRDMFLASELTTEILVFDKSGNQLQTIKTKGIELVLVPTKRGFVTLGVSDLIISDYKFLFESSYNSLEVDDSSSQNDLIEKIKEKVNVKTNANIYQIVNNITVVDSSKGSVEVKTDAVEGEIVKINVKSKIGYVVDQIIVIDGNANIIPVVNGEFVMPDTKVKIEVLYKSIINPQTFDTSVKFALLTIGSVGIYFMSKKYYKKYKKIFR